MWSHFVGINVEISRSLSYYVLVYQLPIVSYQFIPMYSTVLELGHVRRLYISIPSIYNIGI